MRELPRCSRRKKTMKKPLLAVLGVAAACAACCAIPLAIPVLAGLSLAGAGVMRWASLGAGPAWLAVGLGALATTAVVSGIGFRRRRQNACTAKPAARACVRAGSPDAGACGCAPGKP